VMGLARIGQLAHRTPVQTSVGCLILRSFP
jgi:hypothetical protein